MLSTAKQAQTKLSQTLLDEDQQAAIDRLYNEDATLLVAGMGAGKTVISLTAIQELIRDGVLDRVLVFAPLEVCKRVWRQEAMKWEHTQGMVIKLCHGKPVERERAVKFMQGQKGILLISFTSMVWFFQRYKKGHGFDGLLIDELSKLKAGGKGFKKLRPALESFEWAAGLTGTPVAEDFEGLFYQVYALDKGARFGRRKDSFLAEFFNGDYNGYDWTLKPDGAERIIRLLNGLVYTVPDYRHTLPELIQKPALAFMPDTARDLYDEFARTCVLTIPDQPVQTADNMAVLSGKLQQLASGEIYIDDDNGERQGTAEIHESKLDCVAGLVGALEGEPVIICYWFQHELARLERLFPHAINLSDTGANDAWNSGSVPVLLVQPLSCSHGLQLQFGGRNLIFFAPIWSNDIVEQMIARVWRKGQTRRVNVWEILTAGTVDELIVDRVAGKKDFDRLFHKLLS